MPSVRVTFLFAATVLVIGGCAPAGPLRKANQTTIDSTGEDVCQSLYQETDRDIYKIATDFSKTNADRTNFLKEEKTKVHFGEPCWTTAFERHQYYDLLYAEFDDEGNAVDVAKGAAYRDSELYLIETQLTALLAKEGGLNLVVFTHGWHGNARPDNSYSLEFKGLLIDIAKGEEALARGRSSPSAVGPSPSSPAKAFRTIGIEIAWRGDSFDTYVNVWDRKLAADTISKGAVHELFAFLNQFYLDHSCHSTARPVAAAASPCGSVHMLSIGHSFGALIDFQAFVGRLESGLNVDPCDRAYGFGDMTILLNPAFEGVRYRSFFNNAMIRPVIWGSYYGDPANKCTVNTAQTNAGPQVPTVVTLQSLGDWATGTTFPIFRWFTAPYSQTVSAEESFEQTHALGWIPGFRTHTLHYATGRGSVDACVTAPAYSGPDGPKGYCPFAADSVRTGAVDSNKFSSLLLTLDPSGIKGAVPDYLPLWSVAVDKKIMYDHDDFWNPEIVRLISLLFEDAYVQSERLHGQRAP
jgi:hypothetical protein